MIDPNRIYDKWFNELSAKTQAKLMHDRLTRTELRRLKYMPMTPHQWFQALSTSRKAEVRHRFYTEPIPKKSRSKQKLKRGEKK